ncbi:MAG: exodeoxyribonuclease V subunit alpha [Thermodesulfobacteriota bacterium]|nr:exodeoxyribonuclease V subunit alpha [Thermodesulfobacteriota bacterium]
MKKENIYRLYDKGLLSWLDIHFSKFIERIEGRDNPELFLAAALVSSFTRQGNVCLNLSDIGGKRLLNEGDGSSPAICPRLDVWVKSLRKCNVVGKPGEYKPLVLDDSHRLYLFRYWDYQHKLANFIKECVKADEAHVDISHLRDGLERLFPEETTGEINWQRIAAFTALTKRFCVISGGPGTGKTTTVVKILSLIQEQEIPNKKRISIAAPTGKAAARLQEIIKLSREKLDCSTIIKESIPEKAVTIHRLLRTIPNSPYFRYDSRNPLPVDVLIVDEASMVDMALMTKLVLALPQHAKLILLGDKDQLASVEAGAALGDICDTGAIHYFSKNFSLALKDTTGYDIEIDKEIDDTSNISDSIVQLRKNYRFGSHSGIYRLSMAVNNGDSDEAVKLLMSGDFEDISWQKLPVPNTIPRPMKENIIQGYGKYLRSKDTFKALHMFDNFRILCALRNGPYGVHAINLLVEKTLKGKNLINLNEKWYSGRPIMITKNDYNLQLFNGDVGLVLPDPDTEGDLRVFFQRAEGNLKKFYHLSLPENETVYAMTVHKSQGSEFERVLLILPDVESPVMTRELIYTGITRAKKSIEIWGDEGIFRRAISQCINRSSGLRDELWSL